jgi:hypothetical protein
LPSGEQVKTAVRIIAVAVVFLVAILSSHLHGVPKELPGAALDWRLLFHVERATALLAGVGAVLLVGWRATHGDFPIKFGQLEYAPKEAVTRAEEVAEAQERRLQLVEAVLGIGPAPPPLEDEQGES